MQTRCQVSRSGPILAGAVPDIRNCSVNGSHCLLRTKMGTLERVTKVWFESTSQLYHGKLNYDRRWTLLFAINIVLFCQSRDIYISKARKKSCLLKWKSARYSTEPSAGQPLCLCWCSLMIKHHSCFRFNVKITVQFCSLAFKAHLFLIKATFNERRNTYLLWCSSISLDCPQWR